MKTRDLVLIALYAALFAVLDFVGNAFSLFQMPNGGSLGVSVVVLIVAGYHLGFRNGLIVVLLSLLLMFITGEMYIQYGVGQYLLDYGLGFGAYALAVLFPTVKLKHSVFWISSGTIATNALRFVFSTVSGIVYYQVPFWGSVSYQASYLIPTLIFTFVAVGLILPRLKFER